MEIVILLLQLSLPGYAEPIEGHIRMASMSECSARAALYLETFRREVTDDGGTAEAACIVTVLRRQDAKNTH